MKWLWYTISILLIIGFSVYFYNVSTPSTQPVPQETMRPKVLVDEAITMHPTTTMQELSDTTPSTTMEMTDSTTPPSLDQQTVSIPHIASNSPVEIMAWIYPGAPGCGAVSEFMDGRRIDVLKPEYFRVEESGTLSILTETDAGCNGFSLKNLNLIQQYSNKQYITVSSASVDGMKTFLAQDAVDAEHTAALVTFAVQHNVTGIELDFEDFGGWDQEHYTLYKSFVTRLGNALHKQHKKLMIDGPATANQEEENWFLWRYEDFRNLPVDQIVVMTYDHQFDHGVGTPVAPLLWIENVISWTTKKFPDTTRLTFGIPSYGYRGTEGTQHMRLLSQEETKQHAGYTTATRDPRSSELTWSENGVQYFYQDSYSMDQKLMTITQKGIRSVSVWSMGGNPWFSK